MKNRICRVLSLLLALALLCAGGTALASGEPTGEPEEAAEPAAESEPSPALDGVPDTLPLPKLTGNQAHDTASIARSQIGYVAAGGTAYGAWWNRYTHRAVYLKTAWCALFAAWCAAQAGAGMGVAFDEDAAVAEKLFDWLKENAVYDTDFATAPREGDFIFFGSAARVAHVAVVIGYDPETNEVTYVGGNQTNPDAVGGGTNADGHMVSEKTIAWAADARWGHGGNVVLGYGRPNYSGVPEEPAPPAALVLPDAPGLLGGGRASEAAALLRRTVGLES